MPGLPLSKDPKFIARAMRLARKGLSCREVAKKLGVSRTMISRIARQEGHTWGAVNTVQANKAREAYNSERRSAQILVLAGRLDDISERMTAPTTVFSFGGRDNVYTEHRFDKPDSRTLFDLARAQTAIATTMKSLHSFDSAGPENLTDVQRYLAAQKGERPE